MLASSLDALQRRSDIVSCYVCQLAEECGPRGSQRQLTREQPTALQSSSSPPR